MYDDELDARDLFRGDKPSGTGCVSVRGRMLRDEDSTPDDADCYSDADLDAFKISAWRYVGMVVEVALDGVVIADGALWGIEHGQLDEVECDAWEITPAEYGTVDAAGVPTPSVTMGSSLSGVIVEAVEEAHTWLVGIGAPLTLLDAVRAWADPNASQRTVHPDFTAVQS